MILIWSDFARANLQQIYDRITDDSLYQAELFINDLIRAPEILVSQPRIGREVPEANNANVREIIARDYRICYIVREDSIYVTSVLHGRQNFADMVVKPWQH